MVDKRVKDELDLFFMMNKPARQADNEELLDLWRIWIARRMPSYVLAKLTINEVMAHREVKTN